MISERNFAASFHDFWQDLLPMLTPSFVHLVNSGHEQHIVDLLGNELPEVPSKNGTRYPSVVSEFAYYLFEQATANKLLLSDAKRIDELVSVAQKKAIQLVNLYEGRLLLSEYALNDNELEEGYELAIRYELFIKQIKTQNNPSITIPVPIRGAGFIDACNADLSIDNYLVEVKTVKRNISGKDIRQIVVYLALNAASGNSEWTFIGFLNPRRSTFHRVASGELIEHMSGGRASVDVFSQLIDYVCSSDVHLDGVF